MDVGPAILRFYEGLDTPVSLACALLYKYGEVRALVEKSISPACYADADLFQRDYAAVKILSKFKGLKTGIDTKRVALDKWINVEHAMQTANTRLLINSLRGFSPRVEAVIFTAQRKIAACLGDLDMAEVYSSCKWGPGATFSLKGMDAHLVNKLCEEQISVTAGALPYLREVMFHDFHWMRARIPDLVGQACPLRSNYRIVEGCRVTTVDKDAKTDRVIAVEPTGNLFLQLGLGAVIRRRLRRRGVELDDQSRNQELARIASITNELATIDLSSASDTVSREAVKQLLPYDWWSLLDDLRSPDAFVDGKWLTLEKFSSMGNGFTFELESLIFWGLASSVCEVLGIEGEVAVYGDDIIMPSTGCDLLYEVLDCFGFIPNKEKSFASGEFRESCGSHYWRGRDVTPVYQKEVLADIAEVYRFCNRLLSCAHRLAGGRGFDSALRAAWETAVKRSPWQVQHFVPFGDESDDGLKLPLGELLAVVTEFDELGDRIKLPVLSFRSSKKKFLDDSALLAYWLRFWPNEPFNGFVTLRRRGRYVPRRRWFYTYAHNDLSALDVAWLS